MADKKISALTAVADADIGGDDLLHIVDNPGGTPLIIQVREISRDLDLGGAMIVCDIWADGHRM